MGLFGSGLKSLTGVDPFKQEESDLEFRQSAVSGTAQRKLLQRGSERVKIPKRKIAGLTAAELEVEKQVFARLREGPSELTRLGLDLTAEAARGTDPLEDPTIKALIARATEIGQEETGRVGRAVQISGNLGSTTGRDVLGRSVGATQERIISAVSPLVSQKLGITERARTNLIGTEEGLEANRLSLGSAVGALRRNIKQSKFNANIEQFIANLSFKFGTQANILKGLVNEQTVITGGQPSLLTQAAPIISSFITAGSAKG